MSFPLLPTVPWQDITMKSQLLLTLPRYSFDWTCLHPAMPHTSLIKPLTITISSEMGDDTRSQVNNQISLRQILRLSKCSLAVHVIMELLQAYLNIHNQGTRRQCSLKSCGSKHCIKSLYHRTLGMSCRSSNSSCLVISSHLWVVQSLISAFTTTNNMLHLTRCLQSFHSPKSIAIWHAVHFLIQFLHVGLLSPWTR